MYFTAPDFPAISFVGSDMQSGIQYMKERIEEEMLTAAIPPIATPTSQIAPNQIAVQVQI